MWGLKSEMWNQQSTFELPPFKPKFYRMIDENEQLISKASPALLLIIFLALYSKKTMASSKGKKPFFQ
jgi:hypothetical protein